jgi:hypothetical protein
MNTDFTDLDHIFDIIGGNVIDCPYMKKGRTKKWAKWQTSPISKEEYEQSKQDNPRSNWAVITGKLWRGPYKGKYLVIVDLDNQKAIEEFLSNFFNKQKIDDIINLTIVVQHEDAKDKKAHIYFITERLITKRCGIGTTRTDKIKNDDIPSIEVKSDSSTLVICPPSVHKNGYPYKIMGTREVMILDEGEAIKLENVLDEIYERHGQKNSQGGKSSASSLPLPSIKQMDEEDYVIYEGNNRHLNLLRKIDSWYAKSNKTLTFDELCIRANEWDKNHCNPPLGEKDVPKLVEQAMSFIETQNQKRKLKERRDDFNIEKSNVDESIDQNHLFNRIPDKQFAEYVIKTAQKTIMQESSLSSLILYSCLSTYTKHPLNLGIIAPTSEGKTYPVNEIIKFFPSQDVWLIGSMSPKVIVRDKGILIDQDMNPLEPQIRELKAKIKVEKDKDTKAELEEKVAHLYKNSKFLIDLTNKILVFLEPPLPDTWNILKPILSHDSIYIEHPYVFKSETGGQEVKHIVTKGWPACIFCSAKDESDWPVWPEIQSRFFITSPNMVKKKYEESNILIGQKKSLPSVVQEQLIVSPQEIQLAQDCVLMIRKELQKNKDNGVWIPYYNILSQSLPAEKGTDVRLVNRIFSLLNIITKVNLFTRYKLTMGEETMSVSSQKDLEDVLKLTQNISGIPSYKLEFFTLVFIPLFVSKDYPDKSAKDDGIEEERIAVTTTELAENYKQVKGKSITTDNIKKTYLAELENNGLIDKIDSKIDKRRDIYFPIVDITNYKNNKNCTNLEENDNNLQFLRLILSKKFNNIEENWLEMEILKLLKYGIGKTNIFKLLDENDKEICICQFVKEYNISGNLSRYFQNDENYNNSGEIFGKVIKID